MNEKEKLKDEGQAKQRPTKETAIVLTADFGKVYCRTNGREIMRPIKADMTLYEKLGHFYALYDGKSKSDDEGGESKSQYKYSITSAGYMHLNKVAAISILTPQAVIVDGIKQPNPYIERNPRTKAIETVSVRKIGIGYAPSGAVVVIDKTLFYNTYTYFIQSIQAKMKRKYYNGPKKGEMQYPNAAKVGTAEQSPGERWAFFPTEPPLGIWVNYDDTAILDCLDEHTQRQRFGDRIAQKIAERNILKDHPAIGVSQVFAKDSQSGKMAAVTVYGYRHDLNPPQISELLRQAESGAESAPFEIQAEVIKDIDPEIEKEALADAAAVEGDDKAEKFGDPSRDQAPPEGFWEKERLKGGK